MNKPGNSVDNSPVIQPRNLGHFDDSPAQLVEVAFLELGSDELLEGGRLAVVVWADVTRYGFGRGGRGHLLSLRAAVPLSTALAAIVADRHTNLMLPASAPGNQPD